MKAASDLVKDRYEGVVAVPQQEVLITPSEAQQHPTHSEGLGVAAQILGRIAPARQNSGPRTEKLQVMISKSLLERIKLAAEERGLPKSTFINDLLEEILK